MSTESTVWWSDTELRVAAAGVLQCLHNLQRILYRPL